MYFSGIGISLMYRGTKKAESCKYWEKTMDHPAVRALIGWSEVMKDLHRRVYAAACADLSVLIFGERGTGKELIAHALHQSGRRAGLPFVAVSCAEFEDGLIGSELFGHTRGAFTGAERDRKGIFERAHRGTLFLDEISLLRKEHQGKLLRVLETGMVERIGAEQPIRVDVRVIAATNADLRSMAERRIFLPDLYDRLNVFSITAPPLRDRLEDIPLLINHFLDLWGHVNTAVRAFSPEILDLFQMYSWPGNVRELQNALKPLFAFAEKPVADVRDLQPEVMQRMRRSSKRFEQFEWKRRVSKELCLDALAAAGDSRPNAAKLLGISRAHFYRIAKIYDL